MLSRSSVLLLPLALLLTLSACMSPTDPDTPRIRITDPTRYFLRTIDFGNNEYGYDIKQLEDGGYIIVGYADVASTGSRDVLLLRIDGEGKQVWVRTFGGIMEDVGHSVSPTSDGGFILTGYTKSHTNGLKDLWLIKTDENGTMSWSRSYGGEADDVGEEVRERREGGFVVVGYSQEHTSSPSRAWVIRTDELGNLIWNKLFGGSERDLGSSIKETEDGGFIIAGSTEKAGTGNSAIWLFKINAVGDTTQWERFVNGSNSRSSFHMVHGSDGSSAIAGRLLTLNPRESSMLFVKTDASGDMLTERMLHKDAIARSLESTPDGGYIICGYTSPVDRDGSDIVLIKLDINGNTLWKRLISGSRMDRALSVTTTIDGGYILTGVSSSYGTGDEDLLIIKTNAAGVYEE